GGRWRPRRRRLAGRSASRPTATSRRSACRTSICSRAEMPGALQLLWLVPALPLAGFVANGLLALRRPPAPPAPPARRAVSIIGVGVLLVALALSVAIVLAFQRAGAAGPLVFPS